MYIAGTRGGEADRRAVAARRLGVDRSVERYLGPAILAQAGLAIGLLLAVNQRFPDLAPTVTTVVLAAVAVFELIGPVGAKLALFRSGEAGQEPDEAESIMLLSPP